MMSLPRALFVLSSAALATATVTPPLLTLNATLLDITRVRLKSGDVAALTALAGVQAAADAVLSAGPWSVVDGTIMPPSGDMHDYMSYGRYYWPCNKNPCGIQTVCNVSTGLPWISCDGMPNAASANATDGWRLGALYATVGKLAAAYAFTGNATYAQHVALVARAWFVTPATRMNPNANFAEGFPGVALSESWGTMDVSCFFSTFLDDIVLIAPSGAWTADDQAGLVAWCSEWKLWLISSPLALGEAKWYNNHQTYYDIALVSAALWSGDTATAAACLLGALEPPPTGNINASIGVQIWADGELPAEQARTNSIGYFGWDLRALFTLGQQSRAIEGVPNVLEYVSSANHSSIRGAVDFVVPYARGEKVWPWLNIQNATWASAGFYETFAKAAHAGWPLADEYAALALALPGRSPIDVAILYWPL
jgi:hypothetical protein